MAALAVRTAMGSQEATPVAEARMVAEAAMEVLKVAQQALTPCQARGNSAGWQAKELFFFPGGFGAQRRRQNCDHTVRLLR